jgi:hypothetical protein
MTMKITIEIDIDGAAFEESGGSEVARILRELSVRYEEEGFYYFGHLRDINGNLVGTANLED